MMLFIANGLLIAGVCLLGISLFSIQRLFRQIPSGTLRQKWNSLTVLILFLMAGCSGYLFVYFDKFTNYFDLILPAVFFLSSIFVFLVGTLALQTVKDIRRIAFLEYENITDHLIGINNRRCFDRVIVDEIRRANTYELPLSVLLLDIDHFKKINDKYGHQFGDIVLKNLGELIKNIVRKTDIIARYGGDEISIILPHTGVQTASELAERLCWKVEKTPIMLSTKFKSGEAVSITVSIGVAGFVKGKIDKNSLIENADKALYKAKNAGRNRVVVADD